MLKIEYKPLEKIILHDITLVPTERFIDHAVARGGIIGWAHGYLFSINHFPQTDFLLQESVNGIAHWQELEVAKYEEFKSEIKNGSNLSVKVLDQSHHPAIKKIMSKVEEVLANAN